MNEENSIELVSATSTHVFDAASLVNVQSYEQIYEDGTKTPPSFVEQRFSTQTRPSEDSVKLSKQTKQNSESEHAAQFITRQRRVDRKYLSL